MLACQEKEAPAVPGASIRQSALAEGLAVGALIHGGVYFVGAHQNPVQRAIVLASTVVCALVYGTLDALVGMTIHRYFLLLIGFGHSMAEREKGILEKAANPCFLRPGVVFSR